MATEPAFDIPSRPNRRFPSAGGVEYEGGTRFDLRPADERGDRALSDLVESVLADGPYRHGDFVDLPMPLLLVRDDETGDVFRVSIRDGAVRLHVLPETESAGLRAFYERLSRRADVEWSVETVETG